MRTRSWSVTILSQAAVWERRFRSRLRLFGILPTMRRWKQSERDWFTGNKARAGAVTDIAVYEKIFWYIPVTGKKFLQCLSEDNF